MKAPLKVTAVFLLLATTLISLNSASGSIKITIEDKEQPFVKKQEGHRTGE
jgi:hypothetical protein